MATATKTDQTLWQYAHDVISQTDDPDLHALAELTVDEAFQDFGDELSFWGWRQYLDYVYRQQRRTERRISSQGSAAWDDVSKLNQSGVIDVLRETYSVAGKRKFLGDCTKADVAKIRDAYKDRAESMTVKAEAFTKLHRKMKDGVVADLGSEVVESILHG